MDNRTRTIIIVLIAGLLFWSQARSQAQDAASPASSGNLQADLLSLTIAAPLPSDITGGEQWTLDDFFAGGHYRPGLQITFLLRAAGRKIVGFDQKATQLYALTDDTGADLSKSVRGSDGKLRFSSSAVMDIDNDTGQIVVDKSELDGSDICPVMIRSTNLPSRGATKLHIKAHFVLKCSGGSQKVTAHVDSLAVNTAITLGPLHLRVSDVTYNKIRSRWEYDFRSNMNPAQIPAIEFRTPAGQSVGRCSGFTSAAEPNGSAPNYEVTYSFTKRPGPLDIQATLLAGNQVPVDIDRDIGFDFASAGK